MSVYEKIMMEISERMILNTTVYNVPFRIGCVDSEKVVLFVGKEMKSKMVIPKAWWDGIPDFLRGKGWVKIGAKHESTTKDQEESLEKYLDSCSNENGSYSSYVVPILQRLRIVDVDVGKRGRNGRPAQIKLR